MDSKTFEVAMRISRVISPEHTITFKDNSEIFYFQNKVAMFCFELDDCTCLKNNDHENKITKLELVLQDTGSTERLCSCQNLLFRRQAVSGRCR